MTRFEGADLCWIKWRAENRVLYDLLRCKLIDDGHWFDIYHKLI